VAAPFDIPSNVSAAVDHPVRVVLVNMSGQRRQVRLKSGDLDLPVGAWVAIDSRIGERLTIVSDMNTSLDEQIAVKRGDDARVLWVR
jgi:hydrogenase maturation factor